MLNETQVVALRTQAEQLVTRIESGDEEAQIEFCTLMQNPEFDETVVADLIKRAEDAKDRLDAEKASEAAKQASDAKKAETAKIDKSEDDANRERRGKIAAIFSSKGFDEAAVAIETEIDGADAKTLSEVVKTLDNAIPDAELYGWAKHYAYLHRNGAKKALDQMAETTAIKLFVWLSSVLGRALRALESVRNARSDSFKQGLVRQARERVAEAGNIRFQGWALSALERLMAGSDNPVIDELRSDSDLAGTVGASPDGRKAVALLDAMKNRVERKLASIHVGPMRSGKTERDNAKHGNEEAKEATRRSRQLERSKDSKAMKGHNESPPKHGKGKK